MQKRSKKSTRSKTTSDTKKQSSRQKKQPSSLMAKPQKTRRKHQLEIDLDDVPLKSTQPNVDSSIFIDDVMCSENDSTFFCSNDKFLQKVDDRGLYQQIVLTWPSLSIACCNMHEKRNSIASMLMDDEYMNDLMVSYDMTFVDFFKFLLRLCPSLFKGLFITKVQDILRNREYANQFKQGITTALRAKRQPTAKRAKRKSSKARSKAKRSH